MKLTKRALLAVVLATAVVLAIAVQGSSQSHDNPPARTRAGAVDFVDLGGYVVNKAEIVWLDEGRSDASGGGKAARVWVKSPGERYAQIEGTRAYKDVREDLLR